MSIDQQKTNLAQPEAFFPFPSTLFRDNKLTQHKGLYLTISFNIS